MQKISWNCTCFVCRRPIQSGRPTILFATDRPEMVGVCHSMCSYGKLNYGHFQMCPPHFLSNEQVSLLVPFFYKLYSLPGGFDPNRELRSCFAFLLREYPKSLSDPMVSFREFLNEHKRIYHEWAYKGDLEEDFLRLLGQVQKAAREKPLGVEVDFRHYRK